MEAVKISMSVWESTGATDTASTKWVHTTAIETALHQDTKLLERTDVKMSMSVKTIPMFVVVSILNVKITLDTSNVRGSVVQKD
jgi:arginine exporter protein ArgO